MEAATASHTQANEQRERAVVRAAVTRIINEMTTAMKGAPSQQGELDPQVADLTDVNNIEEETEASLGYEDAISIARNRALRQLQEVRNHETTSSTSNNVSRMEVQRLQKCNVSWRKSTQSSCPTNTPLLSCFFARPTNVYFMRVFVTP